MADQRVEKHLAQLLAEKTGLLLDKPSNCTCQYPTVVARNMCGHAPDCPVYIAWAREVYGEMETAVPNPDLRSKLQEGIVAVIRDWPALEEFMRLGDIDGHPQQFVDEIVDVCMSQMRQGEG